MAILDDLFHLNNYVGPESLTELCFKLICENLDIISTQDRHGCRRLREGLNLPSEICDKLITYVLRKNVVEDHNCFLTIFEDLSATKLKHVEIPWSNLTDSSIEIIARHKPVDLELTDCPCLSKRAIEFINEGGENLRSLVCYNPSAIVRPSPLSNLDVIHRELLLGAPNLRRLALAYLVIPTFQYRRVLSGLKKLTYLELNNCSTCPYDLLPNVVPNLVSLTLYNVKVNSQTSYFVQCLSELVHLRHLDISQSPKKNGTFAKPNVVLSDIMEGLPNLVSLDISGTNLTGKAPVNSNCKINDGSTITCSIPGLESRMSRPLEFLGLYGTSYGACRRPNIPAKIIAGDADENQILIAAHVCLAGKKEMLHCVLRDLYHVLRYENCLKMDQALCTVLEAMERYPSGKSIQTSGIATLHYIVKMKEKEKLEVRMKKRIINALFAGMTIHKDDETVMRNGCLALSRFRIPQDFMSNYETLVKVLLYAVTHTAPENHVQRIGLHILNSLACQVQGREKRLLGKLGCVKTMLSIVKQRLEANLLDEVLEVAWSTMWNMTDETPINCSRFFDEHGMNLFVRCVKQFPQNEELLKNMMGLLGNVAEVSYLRRHLMHERYVTIFADLLRSNTDGIEVSFNAAGILAHMASNGPKAWIIEKPTREEVLEFMVEAIDRWDIDATRNINYRSLQPLLRLLDIYHTPQCQHWAVWALANLTNVYPDKYCPLVIKEGGIEKLNQLISDPKPYDDIIELAQLVCDNCARCANNKTSDENVSHSSVDGGYSLNGEN